MKEIITESGFEISTFADKLFRKVPAESGC